MGSPKLALPQNCSKKEVKTRQKEVDEARKSYVLWHGWKGYPPSLAEVPLREITSTVIQKLVESGVKLEVSKAAQNLNYRMYELSRGKKPEVPFEKYTALYEAGTLPDIGKKEDWQYDAVFAAQRLDGMYPWFIERLEDLAKLQKDFPIDDAMLEGVLPKKTTLADLQANGRLYVVSQPSLEGAKPAHGHVMTAPTTLFYVSLLGQLLPLAIQLYPKTSETNPVFTPNSDPGTWLAVKIHAACADTLIHSVYSHAILMHFVMCNVWTCANRTLPTEHPIHAFLKPHFWGTLFVTKTVIDSMNKKKGAQTEVYGTGLAGQNTMVSRLYRDFDFGRYDPHVDFHDRGVDDANELPEFHFRDDALAIWAADRRYVSEMMGLFYQSDDDVKNDFELQAWMADMADTKVGAGIKGLPVNGAGKMETLDQLHSMLTSVLFNVTSRHSSIENGALEYKYIPANPFAYRLAAPATASQETELLQVSEKLPAIPKAIAGYALVATANFDPKDFGQLGRYSSDFMKGAPAGVSKIVESWNDALKQIDASIDERNKGLDTPYRAMKPSRAFNSIWN